MVIVLNGVVIPVVAVSVGLILVFVVLLLVVPRSSVSWCVGEMVCWWSLLLWTLDERCFYTHTPFLVLWILLPDGWTLALRLGFSFCLPL